MFKAVPDNITSYITNVVRYPSKLLYIMVAQYMKDSEQLTEL
jgi:hypothetical protein